MPYRPSNTVSPLRLADALMPSADFTAEAEAEMETPIGTSGATRFFLVP